ncbi:taurine ABC transporter ATP-binding subunit [Aquirhabdus sp.]|uniref:taurine ABC transporter ATP-binding subunit n=1 Tax=Aquirhabdus sp. TaxID=2824160 RepID=UPI00396C7204
MSTLVIDQISATYPNSTQPVLSDISLSLSPGELLVVLGASGSGKTTLLNLIAGFIEPSKGQILLNDRPVKGPGADRGVVFQDDVLLPWQDVQSNVAFGLQLAGVPLQTRLEKVQAILKRVSLEGFAKRKVWELSGGQRQRVGLARALASDPQVLLLDEPFGALDAFIREQMQCLLLDVWADTHKPVFLITHDIEEAVFLATDLVILAPSPRGIVERISLDFSKRFIAGESARSIKSDPQFIAVREHVLQRVFEQHVHTLNNQSVSV